ncbi:MAG: DUF1636 domain-containing protein [Cohaesibacter sp.]|nr:DUF1636 domain-containing protein [Cohaesibacter sp.]
MDDSIMEQPSIIQICVTCRTQADLQAPVPEDGTEAKRSGQKLYERLQDRQNAQDNGTNAHVLIQPVECMNGCQSACTASVQAAGKYAFLIANLDDSDERLDDLLSFAAAHAASKDGLPAWRERPVHVRKNTLARLHPPILTKDGSSSAQ